MVVANGVLAGGASFLAWAIGRELDPDHPASAGAAAVTAPFVLLAGPANLIVTLVLLLSVRAIAGTSGRGLAPVDLAVLGVGAVAICFRVGGGAVATVAAVAPGVTAWWHPKSWRMLAVGSFGILAAVVVVSLFAADQDAWMRPAGVERGLLVSGLAAGLIASWIVPPVRSKTDSRPGGTMLNTRIRLARLTTVTAGTAAVAWAGGPGVVALGPAWVALATTAVWSIAALGE